jgi:hypothetical protein
MWQTLIIVLIIAFSAWQVARKYLPNTMRDLQGRLAKTLDRRGLHRLSHALQPANAPATGCGDGCGNCRGCSLSALEALKEEAKPERMKR